MREFDDDLGLLIEGLDYFQDFYYYNGFRVKLVKGGKEMDSVVESIKELRQLFVNNVMQQNYFSFIIGYFSFISYSRS